METLNLDLPALYADHHVIEVRQLLLALPGVGDVLASSSFQMVEVTYDENEIDADAIKAALDEAGYLHELAVPLETGAPAQENGGTNTYFRHTAAYEQTGTAVSFGQNVAYAGRPLWPCPGLGVISIKEED